MKTEVNVDFISAVLFLFFMFWLHSGWYRIDCALKIEKACYLISEEYVKKPKP